MSARMSVSARVEDRAEPVAEQFLRARDHGVDVQVLVAALRLVRRQAREHDGGGLAERIAVRRAQAARAIGRT